MNELDFGGKQVLVVGGSSGIGNGIAQAFPPGRARRMSAGTRAAASDYAPGEGSHLEGLGYSQLDVGNAQAIEAFSPPFDKLDVLVLAQGAVIYRRGEFADGGLSQGAGGQSDEPDGVRDEIPCDAERIERLADHREFDRGLSLHDGQSRLQRLEDRRGRADAHAGPGLGGGRYPRQRHRAGAGRYAR